MPLTRLHTLLVANRGEIACRVMRTARSLGLRTVAVYSDADAAAPHVRMADAAVRLGPGPAAESYLRIDAILDAARRSGADAVHPGYGFLSENAGFAQACLDAGLVFVGPPPDAIAAMGDKAAAKRRMLAAGVPCLPGYLGEAQDEATLAAEAHQLGLPLLVKAVAGGGGRGMRVVREAGELAAALEGARREALSAFGDGTLMLERLVEGGRHIEIQVFADLHGHVIHLGERDCSAQRRRQKLIEESPSPAIAAAQRAAMGRDAVAAARAVGYVGAGTVEFIVDAAGRHCFLEMNTRLQVEHPVTELVTGLDLVEWQLRVAAGEPLPLTQEQVHFDGHAIEARLCAEDPYAGFVPQTGRIVAWRPEVLEARGVRVDAGIAEGDTVSPYYDAMLAKLIVHGRDRDDAIRRLRAALRELVLFGPRHNAAFLADLIDHDDFRAGRLTTGHVDAWAAQGAPLLQRPAVSDEAWWLAAAVFGRVEQGWRSDSVRAFDLALVCDDGTRRTLRVGTADAPLRRLERGAQTLHYEWQGVRRQAAGAFDGAQLHLLIDGTSLVFHEASPVPEASRGADLRRARAPVAGVVAKVAVEVGATVAAGQPLVCVEAMKMEMWVPAAAAARVTALHVRAGDGIAAGALLAELEPFEPLEPT
jgi:geranyl-CoA carboxylase alpha subunit